MNTIKNSIHCKKPIAVIRSFTDDQKTSFESFLNSDFFEISDDVKKLYHIIMEKISDPNFIGFEKDKLKKVFKNTKLATLKQASLSSKTPMNLNKAVENFLIIHELNHHNFSQSHLLMKAYTRQGLPEYFEKTGRKTAKHLEKQKLRDQSYHLKKYLLHETICSHPKTETLTIAVESQSEMIDSVNDFFYLNKLRQQLELQLRKNFVAEKQSIPESEKAIRYAKKRKQPEFTFLVDLIALASKKKFNETAFNKIRKLFEDSFFLWNKREQRQLLQFLINYITNFLVQGNDKLIQTQTDLFNFGLKHDIFLNYKKIMTHTTFTNIVTTFMYSNLKEETQAFIKNYSKYLDSAIREDAILFAKGYIAMSEKEYTNAVKNLSRLSKESEVAKLQVTCYLLRSSLEEYLSNREYNSLLSSYITRYENYFKNKKLYSLQRRNSFQILGKTVRKFYTIIKKRNTSDQDTIKLKELRAEIKDHQIQFPMKPWILSKIEGELKRRGVKQFT